MTMGVLIADDHALVRAGLRLLLERMEGVAVVGEADSGPEALRLAVALQPDLLLLDLAMPGGGGLDALSKLQRDCPQTKSLVLSMHQETAYVRQALKLGAVGYLVKDSAPVELEMAVRAVCRGEIYLSPAVSKGVVGEYLHQIASDDTEKAQLTTRQVEILQMVAKGLSTKEIARQLDLSVKTVDTHRSQIMKVLDVHEVTGLVRYAIRSGYLSADD